LGCFVDYGWEGVNLFMFKKLAETVKKERR